jgi:hypothetical protein
MPQPIQQSLNLPCTMSQRSNDLATVCTVQYIPPWFGSVESRGRHFVCPQFRGGFIRGIRQLNKADWRNLVQMVDIRSTLQHSDDWIDNRLLNDRVVRKVARTEAQRRRKSSSIVAKRLGIEEQSCCRLSSMWKASTKWKLCGLTETENAVILGDIPTCPWTHNISICGAPSCPPFPISHSS